MSTLSRRSLVTSAAALPALAVPAVAVAATEPLPETNPELLALGERLKVVMPLYESLKLKSRRLNGEAQSGFSDGWGLKDKYWRLYQKRRAKNGGDRAYAEWNPVSEEQNEVALAILKIPSTDRIGDGIRAAAALALDDDDHENAFTMEDVLWEMAGRAGFSRPDKAVQS
jgi:hypothetical protein